MLNTVEHGFKCRGPTNGINNYFCLNNDIGINVCEMFPDIDHIKPLCNGGSNQMFNLQLLCKACHGDKTKIEMTKEQKV